jgi:hypothetical protein
MIVQTEMRDHTSNVKRLSSLIATQVFLLALGRLS